MDPDDIALLGIDVGFSKSRPTTGIAWSNAGKFRAVRTHSDWARRRQHIPASIAFSVIAVDGPLVPLGSDDSLDRRCERLFIRGAFQTRCKPGLSNHGYGKDLRRAASDTAEQLLHLSEQNPAVEKTIRAGSSIVEAFPNAFLGVLLPEARFALPVAGKRRKFDWLYDHAVDSGVLAALFQALNWQNQVLLETVLAEGDHEKRAAWICLLTAACAATSKSETVGDNTGGWFWLPLQVCRISSAVHSTTLPPLRARPEARREGNGLTGRAVRLRLPVHAGATAAGILDRTASRGFGKLLADLPW